MGQSPARRRLPLHEDLLSLHKSRAQEISHHARQNSPKRQPSHVLGTRQIRSQAAHPENRLPSAPPQNQHGRRPRRSLRPLRLPPRNRPRLRLPPNPTRHPFMIRSAGKSSVVVAQHAAPLLGVSRGAAPLRPISASSSIR